MPFGNPYDQEYYQFEFACQVCGKDASDEGGVGECVMCGARMCMACTGNITSDRGEVCVDCAMKADPNDMYSSVG
jgi:hypothetical protein